MLAWFVFFFFQAEDGIRDLTVTGVQTCALPIFTCGSTGSRSRRPFTRSSSITLPHPPLRARGRGARRRPPGGGGKRARRSEERRVGEEGRSRGAPDHLKKKKKKEEESQKRAEQT